METLNFHRETSKNKLLEERDTNVSNAPIANKKSVPRRTKTEIFASELVDLPKELPKSDESSRELPLKDIVQDSFLAQSILDCLCRDNVKWDKYI
jgi:hypothetical protein